MDGPLRPSMAFSPLFITHIPPALLSWTSISPLRILHKRRNGGNEMHFDQNAFGQRIKALRRKENLTLEQMSSALNISIDHLSRIDLGKRGASIDLTLDIADLLNVSVDFLVKGTSRMPPSAQKLIAQIRELLDGFEAM